MYAYGNVFFGNKEDFRNFRQTKATAFVYHNTSCPIAAINNNKVIIPSGVPNYHYFNNIFVCDKLYAGTNALNWHDAGNTYFCRTKSDLWQQTIDKAKSFGFKSASKFFDHANHGVKDFAKGDFSIAENSPARNAGVDLSKYNLPGIEEFSSRDAGAVPYGKPMFGTFRNKSAVKCPPAGSFPK